MYSNKPRPGWPVKKRNASGHPQLSFSFFLFLWLSVRHEWERLLGRLAINIFSFTDHVQNVSLSSLVLLFHLTLGRKFLKSSLTAHALIPLMSNP